jgi:hypothetical protein
MSVHDMGIQAKCKQRKILDIYIYIPTYHQLQVTQLFKVGCMHIKILHDSFNLLQWNRSQHNYVKWHSTYPLQLAILKRKKNTSLMTSTCMYMLQKRALLLLCKNYVTVIYLSHLSLQLIHFLSKWYIQRIIIIAFFQLYQSLLQ